jgi:trk system potassium uptake protein TrkA
MRRLTPQGSLEEYRDASGHLVIAEMPAHESWYGHALTDIETATAARVAFLTRLGTGVLPHAQMVLQDGDLVHMLAETDDVERVQAMLAGPRDAALSAAREGAS